MASQVGGFGFCVGLGRDAPSLRKVNNDNQVVGLNINDITYKLSLFADDVTCVLKDMNLVKRVFAVTETFPK